MILIRPPPETLPEELEAIAEQYERAGIRLALRVEDARGALVAGDRTLFEQVLVNLLVNAHDAYGPQASEAGDDEAPAQVILITRDLPEDPRGDSEEAAESFPAAGELDPLRLVWIQTYETERPGYTYATARASFWALLDSASAASADYERVRLGGLPLPLLDADCEAADPAYMDELCWVVALDGRPLNVYARDGEPGAFSGSLRFEASGSPRLHDADVRLEVPPSSRMTNVRPGTSVDAAADWTIRLDRTVRDPVLFIERQSSPDGGYETAEAANLYLRAEGRVDRITVPRAELARLRERGTEAMGVSLYVNPAVNPLGRIALQPRSGGPAIEVGVAAASFHNVWDVELTD